MSAIIQYKGEKYKVLFPDLFRPHTPAEASEFDASVKELGIRIPVLVDEENGIIDGRNRLEKAAELNIPCPLIRMPNLTRPEKLVIANQVNQARRMLSMAELKSRKQDRLTKVAEMKRSRKSLSMIAERLGVSKQTIADDLKTLEDRGDFTQPDEAKVVGKDNVERPAKQPPKVSPSTVDSPPEAPPEPSSTDGKSTVLEDKNGTPIPDSLRDILADEWHDGAAATIERLTRQAKGVLKWSKYLGGEVLTHLKAASKMLRDAAPSHVCEACKGDTCAECSMSGYIAGGSKK